MNDLLGHYDLMNKIVFSHTTMKNVPKKGRFCFVVPLEHKARVYVSLVSFFSTYDLMSEDQSSRILRLSLRELIAMFSDL